MIYWNRLRHKDSKTRSRAKATRLALLRVQEYFVARKTVELNRLSAECKLFFSFDKLLHHRVAETVSPVRCFRRFSTALQSMFEKNASIYFGRSAGL